MLKGTPLYLISQDGIASEGTADQELEPLAKKVATAETRRGANEKALGKQGKGYLARYNRAKKSKSLICCALDLSYLSAGLSM